MESTDELVNFLRARLDEDERTARDAAAWWGDSDTPGTAPHWRPMPVGHIWNDQDGGIADEVLHWHAAHIARHDPARVLREVEAKREVLAELRRYEEGIRQESRIARPGDPLPHTLYAARDALRGAVRLLAAPYAGHVDFREEWR